MARLQKTTLSAASAVMFLLALYAMAGLAYAAWVHSEESVATWAVVMVVAFFAGVGYQAYVAKKRRRTP